MDKGIYIRLPAQGQGMPMIMSMDNSSTVWSVGRWWRSGAG